jgi:hypothetical protein
MTSKKRIKLLIWLYTKIDISFWLKNEPFYHINDGLKNFLILRLAFILHQLGLLILFYIIDVLLFEYNYEFYDSFITGCFFLHFKEHMLGGSRGENGSKWKLYSFFLHWLKILDAVLNWILMGEGVKNGEKSQNSIKICIKS